MSSLVSLIKLSKSQNTDAAQELTAAVAKRKAQRAAIRAEASANELTEWEVAKQRPKHRFEAAQKFKQRPEQASEIAAKQARELNEKQEREAQASMLFANKCAASASSSNSTAGGENPHLMAATSGSGYIAIASGAMGLTREEKRARQIASWDDGPSRSKYAAKKQKVGAALPGGALNVE